MEKQPGLLINLTAQRNRCRKRTLRFDTVHIAEESVVFLFSESGRTRTVLTSNIVPSVGLSGVSWVSNEEMMPMITIVVTESKRGFQRGVTFLQHGQTALRPENSLLIDVSERKQSTPMYSAFQVVTSPAVVNPHFHSSRIHIHAAFNQPVLILSINQFHQLYAPFH